MATPTYDLIASNVLSSSAFSVTFSSIPATYRDLVIVADIRAVANSNIDVRFNSDTNSNYNTVYMKGTGSAAQSGAYPNFDRLIIHDSSTPFATASQFSTIIQILDYAQTNKHKSGLARVNMPASAVWGTAFRWASTSALNAVELYTAGNAYPTNSSFYLYGIVS